MIRQTDDADRQRAVIHSAAARRYRHNANTLRSQRENASAGALLYESAKSCINAIANQQGSNPVKTGIKFRFLQSFAANESVASDLLDGRYAAESLHTHADQFHLDNSDFSTAWSAAQAFIAAMLDIYHRDNLPTGEQL